MTPTADPQVHRLERSTLGRQIADVIRRDIMFGRLRPGIKLAQQQVCERFGTSRMPVRDALRQLSYEGFLISDGGRHSIVATMSRRDIQDAFLVEGMLHGLAARRVAENGSKDQLAEIAGRHEAMVAASADHHLAAQHNWEFHRRINQLADSRKLVAALRTLAVSIPRDMLVEFPDWIDRANAEHADIVAAMTAHNGERTEQLMCRHVTQAGEDLVGYLEANGVELT